MNRGRSTFSPSTPKKPYTLAALPKPPILRRNSRGMFMTTEEIERDDARMLAQERARRSSRPPVNKPEECFPASGWPTGPQVQQESEEEELPASEVLLLAPSTPPPIPARSPLRPRPAAAAAALAQDAVQPDSPSSSLYEEGAGLGFYQGNPWSLTGRLPPVVGLAPPSLPPSPPSEYLGPASSAASVAEDEGPRGVDYNPDTTGLTSAFSTSSSSGGSLLVSNGTMVVRRRRWSV